MSKKKSSPLSKFGKYKDKTFQEIREIDPNYLYFLMDQFFKDYTYGERSALKKVINNISKKDTLSKIDEHSTINKIIDLIKKGLSNEDIKENIISEFKVSKTHASLLLEQSKLKLNNDFNKDKLFLVDLHLLRYEDLYHEALNKASFSNKPDKQFAQEIDNHNTALDVLYSKEKLLGMHTKGFMVKLNNIYSNKHKQVKKELDLSKLTLEEKKEMIEYIKKCKNIVDKEYTPFVEVKEEKVESKQLDIKSEIEIPIKNKDINIQKEEKSIETDRENIDSIQVFEKLKETMRKKIEETYKKK